MFRVTWTVPGIVQNANSCGRLPAWRPDFCFPLRHIHHTQASSSRERQILRSVLLKSVKDLEIEIKETADVLPYQKLQ